MKPDRSKKTEEICRALLEQPQENQAAFLRQACGDDDDLRREVESMAETRRATAFVPAKPGVDPLGLATQGKPGQSSLVGTRLGLYEVEELIGAGGMGEVYRARDQKLRRAVALKMLPASSSFDPERLARLEREARMLAALNHSNIATIHGLEESEGTRFLVLELVEGETLAERLQRGRIPLEETLVLCRQIAEGLEAAHEKGIIHRDLKPANIKITPDGKVKILDFGLAKEFRREALPDEVARSSTLTKQMNQAGTILGTAAYMSPEQATGKPLDKRTDIWAFGCIVYECLTGQKAFAGETITEIFAAILRGQPDWQALPAATPGNVRNLLHRCLQKDPKERLRDIGDARIEMQEQEWLPSERSRESRPFARGRLTLAGLVILGLGLWGGAALMHCLKPGPSRVLQPAVRSLVRLEPGFCLDGLRRSAPYGFDHPTRTAMAISSDGGFMVYSAVKENPGAQDKSRLYLRKFDRLEAKPIAGTVGGCSPFLSPDDCWVGFWADSKLMKVAVEGGIPTVLCDVSLPCGFSWGADNQIIFGSGDQSGLSRISAAGGKVEILTRADQSKEEVAHHLPCCLPGGKGILFTIKRHPWDPQPRVAVLELATRKWRVLLENAADARYVMTGHLAFLRQGTLLVIPFDPERLDITGQPVAAVENIAQALNTGSGSLDAAAGQFSISGSGLLVYALGGIVPDMHNSLVWVDRQGKAEKVAPFTAPFFAPHLSPNGQRIAYLSYGLEKCVWVYDLSRSTATKLTSEGAAKHVAWSPDGQRVVFGWLRTGVNNLYWQSADGSSPMERLTQSDNNQFPGSWSPDGEALAFVEADIEYHIFLLNVRDRRSTPYLNSRFFEWCPEFSPDGRWMAYVSGESGRPEVYVQSVPAGKGKWQISNQGGNQPLWARNGKHLFYRAAAMEGQNLTQVWSVDVQTGSGFSASPPRLLFEQSGYGGGNPIRCWDVSADGDRFLMVKLEERKAQPLTEMVLVENWFDELRRLTSANK